MTNGNDTRMEGEDTQVKMKSGSTQVTLESKNGQLPQVIRRKKVKGSSIIN